MNLQGGLSVVELTDDYKKQIREWVYAIEIDFTKLDSFEYKGDCTETGFCMDEWDEDEETERQKEWAIECVNFDGSHECINLTRWHDSILINDEKALKDFNEEVIEFIEEL